MTILIADDDALSRRMLEAALVRSGYEVFSASDGRQALEVLTAGPEAPRLAIVDWMMPELDGVEMCRRLRARTDLPYVYLVLLTARDGKEDLVAGFQAGADDFLTKPFDPLELRLRLAVGERLINLQTTLATKVGELEQALSHVKLLQGLIPICMHCKKIRGDGAVWHRLETYIQKHTEAVFTHSLCDTCLEEHYPRHARKSGSHHS